MFNRISNRQEFTEYCLRRLGAPVTQINVDEEQIDDRINDALERFWEFHEEGSEYIPLKVQLTQEHIDTRKIELPQEVISVKNMMKIGFGSSGLLANNLQYREYITGILDIKNMHGAGLSGYVQNMSYLGTMQQVLNGGGGKMIEFNQHRGYVQFFSGMTEFQVGDIIVFEAYVAQNPEEFAKTWNNQWLKKYATALIKEQWGQNLIKLSGTTLPGGMQLNGDRILDEGKADVEKLEEELRSTWQEPPRFFMG